MCPSQLFSSFFLVSLLLLFSIFINSSRADDTSFANCPSSTCKNGLEISYPFWRLDSHNPPPPPPSSQYCGYPGFGIFCSEKDQILRISEDSFYVKEINYSNHSLTLVDIDALDSRVCPRVHHNLTIDDDLPLVYSELDMNLTFYYNCTGSLPDPTRTLDCLNSGGNKSYLYVEDYEPKDLNWYRTCDKKVVVPVTKGGWTGELGAAMDEGFVLHWENATECRKCEASDGRCGYDNLTQESLCFYKDGTIKFHNGYNNKGRNKKIGSKVSIALAVDGAAIAVNCCLMCCFRFIRKTKMTFKKEDHNVEAFLRQYGSLAPTAYSYSDIKNMTNSFKEKLGEGGYGEVYKGNLRGHPVAVKILKEIKGNGEEFINEVASISRTSHVNIVNLLGFCLSGRVKALIYEFMSNGSLDKHIYNEVPNMRWEMLCKIALGIARGLEYLHRGCNSRILHFDIKPHNILLDEDFCPKISDFGLAKLCTRKESMMSRLEARGTIGYIAPEVFCRNFGGVSHKSDVYSYGMMVLEMVGGRKNYSAERSHNSEIYFPRWAYQRILLDENLNIRDMMTNEEEEIAKKMILVGLWCIQTDPTQRPDTGKVIEMLESSLEAFQIPPKPFICSPSRSEGSALNTLERPAKPFLFSTLSSTLESAASTIV
ncbi:LEAF RUST 10 DISEASE-RESISTANCE LOCUS RECEPTOR-LIKE PROTEIN KINASE-like 2.1 [Lycium barbarum]|uniref:LEAF RUST 10 DISEASE-RESISTANCE LOCUS RECEPTOR-LIKE PROTEIN KINASE-like 2.1 n=1 Tax=Lycium barbarum TaxID=112863 RepID=UPI00293E1DD3|nr:LEAF RUST 10 DISEASE-RESISTANCE LOCUS RECEPTOR-LIKE PROTEIN KINASE-like 2.1 [Lycium barbarum]